MIYSNARKLTLSAWLKHHREKEYNSLLKLQKFLFLYEVFSKVAGDDKADFDHLRGYKNGPVFSNVWGDYTKERTEFEASGQKYYENYGAMINQEIALQSSFIVSILSEQELSELTHSLNIWKKHENLINRGVSQVSLNEADLNEADIKLIKLLGEMYSVELVKTSEIVQLDNYYFVLKKSDVSRLTEEHYDVLMALIQSEDVREFHNPVFVEIDEEGALLID